MKAYKILVLACSIIVAGCTTAMRSADLVNKRIHDDVKEAETLREMDDDTQPSVKRATRELEVVKIPRDQEWLREEIRVQYRDMPYKAAIATVLEGRPITYDIISESVSDPGPTRPVRTPDNRTIDVPAGSMLDSGGGVVDADPVVTMPLNARTIKDHLDAICTQAGLSYTIDNGVMVFTNMPVETFSVRSVSSKREFERTFDTFRNNRSSAGGQGGNSAEEVDAFSEIDTMLSQVVTAPGSYSINRSSNSVIVRAAIPQMRKVRKLMTEHNFALGRKAAIKMEIYQLDLSALGSRAFDFSIENLIAESDRLTGLTTSWNINSSDVVSSAIAFPNTIRFGVDRPGRSIDGANGLLRVLRQKGAITGKSTIELVVVNNKVSKKAKTRAIEYVASVSVDQQGGFTGTPTVTTEVRTERANTGTSVQVLPAINESSINLEVLVEESVLVSFEDYSFGVGENNNVSGRLPTQDQSEIYFYANMLDGETMAILGDTSVDRQHSVVNSSLIPVLGDSVSKDEQRSQEMIFVTANIID